jgi:hypothetical protein
MFEVKIQFENKKQAKDFISWLDDGGEQIYWEHCECADLKPVRFIYHHPQNKAFTHNDKRRYENSQYCGDGLTILTETNE